MPSSRLPASHLLLALLVVAIWGTNFVVIRLGLDQFPPFTFAALRFFFASVPFLLFIRPPAVKWRHLASYGLFIGAGQFGFLFFAISGHMAPGLASLIIQTQALFSIFLAVTLYGETVRAHNIMAILTAAAGILVIALNTGGGIDIIGIGCVLAAAFSWSCGNMVVKRMGAVDMIGVIAWSSLFAFPVLAAIAFWVEGPAVMAASVRTAGAGSWAAALWQAFGNAIIGYGIWNWLLARHRTVEVAPMSLAVPVFGMSSAALLLDEPLPMWKLMAAALIIGGLAINILIGSRK